MNRLAIGQQYNTQVSILGFRHLRPTSNATIGLYVLTHWSADGALDPFVANDHPIGTKPHDLKIGGHLHAGNVAKGDAASKLRPNKTKLTGPPPPALAK